MHDSLVAKGVAGLVCAVAMAGCSLWLHTDERQCRTNADCVKAKLGTLCVQEVCTDDLSMTELDHECPDGSACTALTSDTSAPAGTDCARDADCKDDNAPRCLNGTCVSDELGNRWVCVANQPGSNPDYIRYNFHVVEFLSGMPPKNIVVDACRNNDAACEHPIDTFTDVDMNGTVEFKLPFGFYGFFQIHSDAMDTLLYVTKPIERNTANRDLPLLATTTVELTAQIARTTFDTNKGIVTLEALDCSDKPQGGIHFESESGQSFYLVDQVPNTDAMETVYDSTNNSANGGFINVDPGFVKFTARLGVDGLVLGTFNAQVRPNTMTYIEMHF